jgi:hypothetical protein
VLPATPYATSCWSRDSLTAASSPPAFTQTPSVTLRCAHSRHPASTVLLLRAGAGRARKHVMARSGASSCMLQADVLSIMCEGWSHLPAAAVAAGLGLGV